MRIGFAIQSLDGGGAEFVTRQWTAALSAAGHEVSTYTYSPEVSLKMADAGERHRHFPLRSTASRWLVLPFWLRHQVRRDRLDVLVTMLTFTNLVGIAGLCFRRSTARLVIVQHNILSLEMRSLPRFERRLKTLLAHRLYRHADAAIGVSHPVVADLLGACKLDPDRAFTIPNPIVQSKGSATPPSPEKLSVAFVGRLTAQKRPLLYVDTLAALAAQDIEVRGLVLGEGPMLDEMRVHAESLKVRLDFRGWQDPWWVSAPDADCLLLPSVREGFGNVCVEAAAAGIPSVACSAALGTADAVVPGFTGELVLGSTAEQFADGVIRATAQRRTGSLQGWLNRFSVDRSTSMLLQVLARACAADSESVEPRP